MHFCSVLPPPQRMPAQAIPQSASLLLPLPLFATWPSILPTTLPLASHSTPAELVFMAHPVPRSPPSLCSQRPLPLPPLQFSPSSTPSTPSISGPTPCTLSLKHTHRPANPSGRQSVRATAPAELGCTIPSGSRSFVAPWPGSVPSRASVTTRLSVAGRPQKALAALRQGPWGCRRELGFFVDCRSGRSAASQWPASVICVLLRALQAAGATAVAATKHAPQVTRSLLGVPPAGPSSIPPDITGSWQSPPGSSFSAPNPNTAMLAALTTPRLAAPCHAQRCKSAARPAPLLCRVRPDRVLLAQHFERRGCQALPRGTCDRVEKETRRGVRIDGLGGLQIGLRRSGRPPAPLRPAAAQPWPGTRFQAARAHLEQLQAAVRRGATRRTAAWSWTALELTPVPHLLPPPRRPATTTSARRTTSRSSCPCRPTWTGCVRLLPHCPSCAARLPGAARCLLPPACLPQPHLPAPPRRP